MKIRHIVLISVSAMLGMGVWFFDISVYFKVFITVINGITIGINLNDACGEKDYVSS